jgi:hypothetical protein
MPSIQELKAQETRIQEAIRTASARAETLRERIARTEKDLAALRAELANVLGGATTALVAPPPVAAPAKKKGKGGRPRKVALAAKPAAPAKPAAATKPAAPAKPVGRKGSGNTISQKALMHQILAASKDALSPDQIVAAMKAKGYKFATAKPKSTVSVVLYSDKKLFKTAKPGLFTVK